MQHYDNLLNLSCDTTITTEKDGYYTFEDTVFYGEKGGMPGDKGTINGLEVIDLKWEDDILYHKVDGILENPIHMEVDKETRIINTTVQSAYHLLDGYYGKMGLYIVAIGVTSPENQWYEVNSKDLDEKHLEEVQNFMNDTLLQDIPAEFTYYKGSEYPNPKYANHDEVRVVTFGDIDSQPCGTPHVNNVNQIGSFIILGSEKTSRGTRIYTTVSWATNIKLKKYYNLIQELRKTLNGKEDNILENIQSLRNTNKVYKKQIDDLQKELTTYKVNEILQMEDNVLVDVVDVSLLRPVSQALLNEISSKKILITTSEEITDFSIISPEGKARDIYAAIQESLEASGGGSPKIVTARSSKPKEEIIELLQNLSKTLKKRS